MVKRLLLQPYQTFLGATLVLLTSISSGEIMASSQVLPKASDLSGQWQVQLNKSAEKACSIELQSTAIKPNLTWHASGDVACLEQLLGSAPQGWRPTPDGITLTDKTGGAVAFFERTQDGYEMTLPDDAGVMILRRIQD
ncbi:protease inhibitor Inh/omp19 family protein [Yersinia nurmii]|uniref:Protease inhibitor Inh/omp19 family protein n=1 Tax=Yersinia nurmii TaxID=685706 RepID=A0AAW7JYG7_9GAMM|nr:protease inhibitor Inh/omp19 family protein [Yersinia nurmii]MDN0086741.1 protease inhibitor Inh/omp19 family protein [Yersinia nurmii]CNE39896.1 Proteinase inhibitor precursor [Yersinia nurmii]